MQTLLVLVAMMTFAAEPMWELELTTGDILRGKLVEQSGDILVLEHPVLGRLTIPAGLVQVLRELPATVPSVAPPPAVPAPLTGDAAATEQQVMDDAINVAPQKATGSWNSSSAMMAPTGK